MRHRGLRMVAGVVLIALAIAGAFVIFTNDDRDRLGAALVGLLALGGIRLLRSDGRSDLQPNRGDVSDVE